jgi:hypothetical protein
VVQPPEGAPAGLVVELPLVFRIILERDVLLEHPYEGLSSKPSS